MLAVPLVAIATAHRCPFSGGFNRLAEAESGRPCSAAKPPEAETPPEEVFEKLQPFKDLVADDLEGEPEEDGAERTED